MTHETKNEAPAGGAAGSGRKDGPDLRSGSRQDPDWAAGLKRLYDSVVEETLPDSIQDLLAKLDAGK